MLCLKNSLERNDANFTKHGTRCRYHTQKYMNIITNNSIHICWNIRKSFLVLSEIKEIKIF